MKQPGAATTPEERGAKVFGDRQRFLLYVLLLSSEDWFTYSDVLESNLEISSGLILGQLDALTSIGALEVEARGVNRLWRKKPGPFWDTVRAVLDFEPDYPTDQ